MPPKKKADNDAYQQLKKDIPAGTPGRLYVFHGEEDYLRDYYLGELKRKLLSGGMEEFNLHIFQGKEMDAQKLSTAVDCLPMMSERTLVLVYDYDLFKAGEEQRQKLISLFAGLPDYVCLIFIYDLIPYKSDARTKLAQALKEYGSVVQFSRQEQGDLVSWLKRRFRALGKEIDSAQAEYLIFLCGGLMTGLVSEVEKIGAYAKGGKVTREDIDAVAAPVLDAVVFKMTDAIAGGDFDRAAAVLGDLFQLRQEPIMILSVLGKQLRQLYSARLALEHGKQASYLMELWGMRQSYPAQRLLQSCRRYSLGWCRRAARLAEETDLAMKSTGRDNEELLIDLLLQLAMPVSASGERRRA